MFNFFVRRTCLVIVRSFFISLENLVFVSFNRYLPWIELTDDRWNRAIRLGFGKRTSIYNSTIVIGDVSVGEDCWIGPNCLLDGTGGLTICSNCQLSAGVQKYTHNTIDRSIDRDPNAPSRKSSTLISSNVYLGPNVIVSMGVSIDDGCIIGAGSFISSGTCVGPRSSLWYGTPARFVRSLE